MNIPPNYWIEGIGYAGVLLTVATYSMRRMIPLRIVGISANVVFIFYGVLAEVQPQLILHAILLPLNTWRLIEMQRLTKKVASAAKGELSMDWLRPFMTRRKVNRGDFIFRKSDPAAEMFFTLSGRYRLPEIHVSLGEGELIGEMGLVSSDNQRICSFECIQDGELLSVRYSRVLELYYQNPHFGFYLLQLISQRLLLRIDNLESTMDQTKLINARCVALSSPLLDESNRD